MGVFSGLITFGMAFWFYSGIIQSNEGLNQEDKRNGWSWFWIGGGVYLGGYMAGIVLNWMIIGGELPVGIGAGFGQASGGDTGALGIILEFTPMIIGLLAAYLIRVKFVLQKQVPLPSFVKGWFEEK